MTVSKLLASFILLFSGFNVSHAQQFTVLTKMLQGNHTERITVSETDIAQYLLMRPKFGDTAGKKADIITTLASATMLVKYGAEADMPAATARAEYYFKHKDDVDKILVVKHLRKMHLMKNGKVLKTYPIALGWAPVGQKVFEGDGKTPEGIYILDARTFAGNVINSYHISYPNAADKARAAKAGKKAGTNIMIHGTDGPKKKKDFTNGCVALSNADLADLAKRIFVGTKIELVK